ncbi:MAG: class I SAM-dependent methyltransferase [Planctomycetota bacterium]
MTETTRSIYDRSAARWRRDEPVLLSDYTARPFLLDWCEPVRGQRILDLGCGEGYVARQLAERGAGEVVGVDLSPKMIEGALAQRPGEPGAPTSFSVGDSSDLSRFEDASFDVVLCVFLFNYLDVRSTRRTMAEAARVLRPRGRFLFSIPHPMLPFVREERAPFYFARGQHGYFSGTDAVLEGKIWRRDGDAVPVRCVHKPLEVYFEALAAAGFDALPRMKELRVTDEHLALDPDFFGALRDEPLHLALQVRR